MVHHSVHLEKVYTSKREGKEGPMDVLGPDNCKLIWCVSRLEENMGVTSASAEGG